MLVASDSERSRWFRDYGPYMVVDDRNWIVTHGLDLDDLEDYLAD